MVISGSCECRNMKFEIQGQIPDAVACHCSQCRKTSGHVWASVLVPDEQFTLLSDDTLKWRCSSEFANRGFCTECGSRLFYKHNEEKSIAVAAGTLDPPSGLGFDRHIFVKDKGDYYQIPENERQIERY